MKIEQTVNRVRQSLAGESNFKTPEYILKISTKGEYSMVKSTPTNIEVISPADSAHKHKLVQRIWDKKELGPDVSDFTEFTAIFKTRLDCESCTYKVISSERALY